VDRQYTVCREHQSRDQAVAPFNSLLWMKPESELPLHTETRLLAQPLTIQN